MKFGAAAGGAALGASLGSVVPVVGTLIGGGAGALAFGAGAGKVTSWLFPERDVSNVSLACDVCSKQNDAAVETTDWIKIASRHATPYERQFMEKVTSKGNSNGDGLDGIAGRIFEPLIGGDYPHFEGQTICEYLTTKANCQEIDVAQAFRDAPYMEACPPARVAKGSVAEQYVTANNGNNMQMKYDGDFNEGNAVSSNAPGKKSGQTTGL